MKPGEDTVDGAIARVLGAETEARAAMELARSQSQELLETAHQEVRAVHDRGERRTVAIRRSVERRIAEREAEVSAAIAALRNDRPEPGGEAPRVECAVARLAAELSGDTP